MSKYRYILGIQSFANQDSGASILRYSEDGDVLDYVAISEERLVRKKYPYTFPVHSLNYCMEHYGLDSLDQVDLLVTDYIRIKRWFNSGPAYNISEYDYLKIKLDIDPAKIVTISHHMAHAAAVYYTSGFDDAAVLIVDGNGSDLQTTSFLEGKGDDLKYLDMYRAHGVGNLYGAVTQFILNLGMGGEGKTMGLAPYGEEHPPVLDLRGDLDGIRNDYSRIMRRQPNSDVLHQIDDKYRIYPFRERHPVCTDKDDVMNPYFSRIAFEVQTEAERALTHLGKEIEKQVSSKNLCVCGGVALNSVANKIMFDATGFERIHVFPACSDSGIPFGLAVWGYYNASQLGDFKRRKMTFNNAYTGRDYPQAEIDDVLTRFDIPHSKTSPEEVAGLLAEGNIVAWFQGGSEFGPRALGHRSILADSRRGEMRDIVNRRVKHREGYRPFAPAIVADACSEYFDIEGESPYMLLVADVLKPDVVPAVTHIDNTARVQTVTSEGNGVFYELVKSFGDLTGVPCIMNTSFNDAGEPIVETPEDAIICFCGTEMDYLVLGDKLVSAEGLAKAALYKDMTAERTERIAAYEAVSMQRYFPEYDAGEKDRFIASSNAMSEYHVRYRPKFALEQKLCDWNREKKRILVVGTADHTDAILRRINGFYMVDIVGFVSFDGRYDLQKDVSQPLTELSWDAVAGDDYDEILLSSFEYLYDVRDRLKGQGVTKPVYEIYDNASRNLMETLDDFPEFQKASTLG